jgi:sugar lactone lactonase YvrE
VPAPLVTSVAFGGPDLDLLLVTTARWELDEATLDRFPLSGGAFLWEGDAVGLPEPMWAPPAGDRVSRPS